MSNTGLSEAEIEALVQGTHADPFAILGPHAADDGGTAVRIFNPQADTASLITDDTTLPMERLHWDGFFEAHVAADLPFAYEVEIVTHAGERQRYGDPYAFPSPLDEYNEHLLIEGTHLRIYEQLGARIMSLADQDGTHFAVWAPNAARVSVVGDFNNWDGRRHPMRFHSGSGIWDLFVPGMGEGMIYKYEIQTNYQGYRVAKADPVAFAGQMRPETASVVWDIEKYRWQDDEWLAARGDRNATDAPISIYEVHLGSWRRKGDNEPLSYRELADQLIPYVTGMGFTHIELLPVSEYPYDGSWGYQVTGYFAPTSRFGTPDDFMAFVDACHQANIGIILDWVPAHFPTDQHGLGFFDGTHLYEHEDPRRGAHPDWGTYIFNYGRREISQFLISNALYWLDKFHIDGLRVDAVASMLYLDFSRQPGEWLPNRYGGRENIEAVDFVRRFNEQVHEHYPDVLTFAEESTSWPGVTHSLADNGLGFDYKWNMGWMHDTLQYMSNDPVYRAFHHSSLTFSLLYAFSEKFVLPFSHDEVVHLKKNMLDKMPGDVWQKFANLRLLYGYQWTHPGKKLLFMGAEFGQWQEWSEARSLDWHLLDAPEHAGLQEFMRALNAFYQSEPALYRDDNSWEGFQWLEVRDSMRSTLAYMRIDPGTGAHLLIVCNFTPVVREDYRLGVPELTNYVECLNSDRAMYAGSDVLNEGRFEAEKMAWHEQPYSIRMTLPPLGIVILKPDEAER